MTRFVAATHDGAGVFARNSKTRTYVACIAVRKPKKAFWLDPRGKYAPVQISVWSANSLRWKPLSWVSNPDRLLAHVQKAMRHYEHVEICLAVAAD